MWKLYNLLFKFARGNVGDAMCVQIVHDPPGAIALFRRVKVSHVQSI